MLGDILREGSLRNAKLWQRANFVPGEILNAGHEIVARSLSANESTSRRVAFLLGNELSFVVAILAVMRRGDSAVLLNPVLAPVELSELLARTTPRLIVTSSAHAPKLRDLKCVGRQIWKYQISPDSDILVFEMMPWAAPAKVDLTEFVCQITSGVSGRSRIISRTYENIANELENYISAVGVSDRDIFLCPVPLFHAYGLFNALLPSLVLRSGCILAPGLLAGDIASLTEFHRPTILLGVPFIYELMTKSPGVEAHDYCGYRYLFSAGAMITPRLADEVLRNLKIPLNPLYGTTETGILAVGLDRRPYVSGYVGSPIGGKTIRIFHDHQTEVVIGDEGEIGISSFATGSYLDPIQMSTSFESGWFFPGDIGRLDADGNLYVLGRKSSIINVASLKVDPAEVESAILSSGLAADCAVVGVPREQYGEFVRAYVVPQIGASIKTIRATCRQRLAAFKVPREIILVDDLPRSATGKVLRKYLIEPIAYGREQDAP